MVYNESRMILCSRRIFHYGKRRFPRHSGREYEGTAGGGAVSCKVSGKRQLLSLTIDKDAVDPEEVEMLQDMIVAAVNDALKKGEETRESEMSKIGGAGMGGIF